MSLLDKIMRKGTIFENVRFINESTGKQVSHSEFDTILKQYETLYNDFYRMIKNESLKSIEPFNDHDYKKLFNKGVNTRLIYSYSIGDTLRLNGVKLDRYMMKLFMQFAKSNGFRVHHDVVQNTTYGTNSSKFPDMIIAFATPNYGYGKHKAIIVFGCNDDLIRE